MSKKHPFECRIIVRDDDGEEREYRCANAFVANQVSRIFHENHPDADRVVKILNLFFEREPDGLKRIDHELGYGQ